MDRILLLHGFQPLWLGVSEEYHVARLMVKTWLHPTGVLQWHWCAARLLGWNSHSFTFLDSLVEVNGVSCRIILGSYGNFVWLCFLPQGLGPRGELLHFVDLWIGWFHGRPQVDGSHYGWSRTTCKNFSVCTSHKQLQHFLLDFWLKYVKSYMICDRSVWRGIVGVVCPILMLSLKFLSGDPMQWKYQAGWRREGAICIQHDVCEIALQCLSMPQVQEHQLTFGHWRYRKTHQPCNNLHYFGRPFDCVDCLSGGLWLLWLLRRAATFGNFPGEDGSCLAPGGMVAWFLTANVQLQYVRTPDHQKPIWLMLCVAWHVIAILLSDWQTLLHRTQSKSRWEVGITQHNHKSCIRIRDVFAPVLSKSHLWFCQRITIWGSFASSCASMDSARLLHNQRNVKEVLKASPSNSKSTVLKRPYSRNEAFKSFNGLFHFVRE